jgi:cholesterol transport system auxiliary component
MTAMPLPLSRRSLLLAGAATLALGACGSLIGPSNPSPQIWRLEPALAAPSGGAPASWQLAVARPTATAALDTERIALLRGAVMDYYADVQWNDAMPRLVQALLVEAFEKSGRVPAVAREAEGIRADYVLQCDIRDFDAQYGAAADAAPQVVVEIEARLLAPRGEVVASLDARQTARAGANSVAGVVQAFDQALGAALGQIVSWTMQAAPVGGAAR